MLDFSASQDMSSLLKHKQTNIYHFKLTRSQKNKKSCHNIPSSCHPFALPLLDAMLGIICPYFSNCPYPIILYPYCSWPKSPMFVDGWWLNALARTCALHRGSSPTNQGGYIPIYPTIMYRFRWHSHENVLYYIWYTNHLLLRD
jgi:hypothetical protein